MKPQLCAPRKIAVIVTASGMAGRDYLSGVFRYVNTKTQWMLELFNNVEECLRWQKLHGKPDGVISLLPHDRNSLRALLKANVPTVIVDTPLPVGRIRTDKISFIQLNDEAIGSAAAEHLLSRGRFNSFACLIDEPYFKYPFCREQGFRNRLAKAGESVKTVILPEKNATDRDMEAFDLTIARLPRPIAAFAVRDRASLKLYDACRRLKLSIPDEIAILGVDNDELFCNSLPVPTSILPDHEQVGFITAQTMARILRGAKVTDMIFAKPVKDIVLRASTRIVPPTARIVSEAMSYIEKNVSGSLHVSEIATNLGISRRLLDLRFRQIQNMTVLNAIAKARIGQIKKMLLATSNSIMQISSDCGFSSPAALVRFFRRQTGMTPNRWRQMREPRASFLWRNAELDLAGRRRVGEEQAKLAIGVKVRTRNRQGNALHLRQPALPHLQAPLRAHHPTNRHIEAPCRECCGHISRRENLSRAAVIL